MSRSSGSLSPIAVYVSAARTFGPARLNPNEWGADEKA